MNDRYLYRAKRKNNGKWVQGYYANCLFPSSDVRTGHFIIKYPGEYHEIFTSTICQCTGLKDKNGKLIWENDIVWDSEERKFYKIIFSQEDMCYYAQDADGYKDVFESCYGSSIEVESNIFDNPELEN